MHSQPNPPSNFYSLIHTSSTDNLDTIETNQKLRISYQYNKNIYLSLKGNYNILNEIKQLVNKIPENSGDGIIAQIRVLLISVLNCNYGELYVISNSAMEILRPLLENEENGKIVRKLYKTFKGITALLLKLQNEHPYVLMGKTENENKSSVKTDIDEEQKNQEEVLHDDQSIICRLCEQQVLTMYFREHTKYCARACKLQEKIAKNQNLLLSLQNKVNEHFLNTVWPGDSTVAIYQKIPMLRASLLLEKILHLKSTDKDAINELEITVNIVSNISIEIGNDIHTKILMKVKNAIIEKRKIIFSLLETQEVLKKTRLSGDPSIKIKNFVTVADFDFIKRISSGAYARVFLAKKKTTNDIYAIKVISKNDVLQKNHVKRVMMERDILLQFNNPYIVNFCMYF